MVGDGSRPADPVIVLALPRSYSSLITALLGQHMQCFGVLETQLFEVDTVGEWWDAYGETHDSDGLTRTIAEILFGGQSWQQARRARQWLWDRSSWTTAEIAWLLAERLHPLALVEKTPLEDLSLEAVRRKVERRLKTFPNARFLHIVRHPLHYGISHLAHLEKMARATERWRMEVRYRMMAPDDSRVPDAVDPQILWLRVNKAVDDFLRDMPARQKLRIRGEDVLSDPDAAARRIAVWLGARHDARAIDEMKHTENSPFARLGPKNALFGGDPTFFRDPVLRVGSPSLKGLDAALPWRHDGSGFRQDVIDLAERFGYRRTAGKANRLAVRT